MAAIMAAVLLALLAVVVGLVVLTKAADAFVEGAARLSAALKVSPVVIGAVVVGFGTSAPEMVVSGIAASQDKLDIAVGNVIGSNIANLSLVLGVSALLCTMTVTSGIIKREAPLSTASVILFAVLVHDGLERWEGILLVVCLVGALVFILWGSDADNEEMLAEVGEYLEDRSSISLRGEGFRTVLGLVGVIIGAQLTVEGASTIADELGLGEGFVAVTLVALGTSLPELVTAIAAARKNEHELIIGNLLGSNLFNSLGVGAVAAIAGPGLVSDDKLVSIGLGSMLLVAFGAWLFMFTSKRVVRWEAIALLGVYAVTIPLLA
jgi:cation:H+ antiporter